MEKRLTNFGREGTRGGFIFRLVSCHVGWVQKIIGGKEGIKIEYIIYKYHSPKLSLFILFSVPYPKSVLYVKIFVAPAKGIKTGPTQLYWT